MQEKQIILNNNRLKVNIAQPGQLYNGSRFDWTGIILQVTLDDRHTFGTHESFKLGEGCGGMGLCNEFGIEDVIGYEEALVNEKFPKIGIGLLTKKDEEEYCFYRPYEVEPFPLMTDTGEDWVAFTSQPIENKGYALELNKTIKLRDNFIDVEYTLKNVGIKPIMTNEYNHNFVSIDDCPIGPQYTLRLPFEIKPEKIPDVLELDGKNITWNRTPDYDFYLKVPGFDTGGSYSWEITNESIGAGMREYSNFPVQQFALWGRAHVVSAEIFCEIYLEPEQTKSWKRTYEFYKPLMKVKSV